MKALQLLLCAIFAALLVVAGAPAASARATDDDDECRRVSAIGVGQDLGGGNTTATISRGGILNGTTTAHFEITGGTGPVLTFAGTVVFTTKKGTLTVGIAGTFNIATGAFAASGPVTSGTGAFAGATGTLNFAGVENLTTGTFTETVKGRICLDDGDDDEDDDG